MKFYIQKRKDAEQHNQKVNKSQKYAHFHWVVSIPIIWKTDSVNKDNMFL